jgi:hypothetical protein
MQNKGFAHGRRLGKGKGLRLTARTTEDEDVFIWNWCELLNSTAWYAYDFCG